MWDYDSISEHILFELDGRKVLAHFDKNGYAFILDRTNGQLIRVFPFVDRITWGEITPDGKVTPKIYPDQEGDAGALLARAGRRQGVDARGLQPARPGCCTARCRRSARRPPGGDASSRRESRTGARVSRWTSRTPTGSVSAFDPATGREVWRWRNETPMCASVLATGGGLVFAGEPTGEFNALNARTGELLWQFQCGSGHHSSPTTYSVGGRQYIAVPSGWGGWIEGFNPGMLGAPHGAALFVFALPD